jgi:hypothetical protein
MQKRKFPQPTYWRTPKTRSTARRYMSLKNNKLSLLKPGKPMKFNISNIMLLKIMEWKKILMHNYPSCGFEPGIIFKALEY